MKRWNKLKIDRAEPNWAHAHASIKCRADWDGAHVFEFPNESCLDGNILAYSLGDAMSVLEEIKTSNETNDN